MYPDELGIRFVKGTLNEFMCVKHAKNAYQSYAWLAIDFS